MTKPLNGITVLELHRFSPGQFCTMVLADFGANVIKVEEPLGLRFSEETELTRRPSLNRGKKSVVLNLKSERGRELYRALAERADVIVEGFRPGVLDRLGVGYASLKVANPGLVYCAISGFGQDGPYRDRAGHDINYLSLSGFIDLTGERGKRPVSPGLQMADIAGGGMPAVIGVLLALVARLRTGEGQQVDVSMHDGAVSWLLAQLDSVLAGQVSTRGDSGISGRNPNYGIYETKDGRFLSIGALEPWFWERLLVLLDLQELKAASVPLDVRRRLEERFAERTLSEWDDLLRSEDVCYAPVLSPGEVLQNDHLLARGMVRGNPPPLGQRAIGPMVKLTQTPGETDTPAPRRGQHTESVLGELGVLADELTSLRDAGVIQ